MKPVKYSPAEKNIINGFHELYYGSDEQTWKSTYWLGVKTLKCPLDLWIYQELLHELRPSLIIETGTSDGGSAYYLASICDLLGSGRIITIDIEHKPSRPTHPRVTYFTGSSTSPEIFKRVKDSIKPGDNILVILDSDHSQAHVSRELELYSDLVGKGGYLVVEDTNVNGHPVVPDYGAGPWEAVEEFLQQRKQFVRDAAREKFLLTFNPAGFLKRVG